MRVALFGGTGFVGGYLVDALVEAGHEPSVLVRPGSESKLRRADKCRKTTGDLDSPHAVRATLEHSDAAIYTVGILREHPGKGVTFEKLQYRGAVAVIEKVMQTGITRFLLMSANGVKDPGTAYQSTKYRAEEALRASGLDSTIFRPSVIFGDPRGAMEFATQLYRDMIAPPLPGVGFHTGVFPSGGDVLMSPVAAEDVASAFVASLDNPATIGNTYELGGPEILSWNEILMRISAAVDKRKLILPMPIGVMKLGASLLDWLPFFPVTRDQLTMLAEGNTADPATLEKLIGRAPKAFTPEALSYLST